MLKPLLFILVVSLLPDGGMIAPQPSRGSPDAGALSLPLNAAKADAGTADFKPDAGPAIPWPQEELHPLATLDGPAVLAGHAVLQRVLQRFPKESAGSCAYSPQSLEVLIAQHAGWYFVRVNRRVDKCPGFGPGVVLETDGFELYAVSPDGRVERYPFHP